MNIGAGRDNGGGGKIPISGGRGLFAANAGEDEPVGGWAGAISHGLAGTESANKDSKNESLLLLLLGFALSWIKWIFFRLKSPRFLKNSEMDNSEEGLTK